MKGEEPEQRKITKYMTTNYEIGTHNGKDCVWSIKDTTNLDGQPTKVVEYKGTYNECIEMLKTCKARLSDSKIKPTAHFRINTTNKNITLDIVNSYDIRDTLKERGFQYDPNPRTWNKCCQFVGNINDSVNMVSLQQLVNEYRFLSENKYIKTEVDSMSKQIIQFVCSPK